MADRFYSLMERTTLRGQCADPNFVEHREQDCGRLVMSEDTSCVRHGNSGKGAEASKTDADISLREHRQRH